MDMFLATPQSSSPAKLNSCSQIGEASRQQAITAQTEMTSLVGFLSSCSSILLEDSFADSFADSLADSLAVPLTDSLTAFSCCFSPRFSRWFSHRILFLFLSQILLPILLPDSLARFAYQICLLDLLGGFAHWICGSVFHTGSCRWMLSLLIIHFSLVANFKYILSMLSLDVTSFCVWSLLFLNCVNGYVSPCMVNLRLRE